MALMWFKKAAEGGDHDAQRRLGSAYMDGTLGLKTDLEAAAMWLQKAADGDSEEEDEEEEEEEREEEEEEEDENGEWE